MSITTTFLKVSSQGSVSMMVKWEIILPFALSWPLLIIAEIFYNSSPLWFVLKPLSHMVLLLSAIMLLRRAGLPLRPNFAARHVSALLVTAAIFILGVAVGVFSIYLERIHCGYFVLIGILGRQGSMTTTEVIVRALYVLLINAFVEEYYFRKYIIDINDNGFHYQLILFTLWHVYLGIVGMFILALPMAFVLGRYYAKHRDFVGLFFAHMFVNIGLGVGYMIF